MGHTNLERRTPRMMLRDFEVAIIDENTRDFVTKYYVPEANDDVLGYQDSSQVEHIANLLFKKDFQVK